MGFDRINPGLLRSLLARRHLFMWGLWLICTVGAGCNDSPSRTDAGGEGAQPGMTARGVRLETHLGGERILVQGDHLIADDKMSVVDIKGNVRLQREPYGEIWCDRLQFFRNDGRLDCVGNVQGLLSTPWDSVLNGDSQ